MWQPFLPSLLFLLLQLKLCLSLRQCKWFASLIDTPNLMGLSSSFINQEEVREVAAIFHELKDSPVDPNDKDARYYGFPYFLKVTLFCIYRVRMKRARNGGLRPIVRVSFEEPVNPVRQKQERLRIEMMTAPHRMNDHCDSEEVCKMFWFAPMPFLNGSVVTRVLVRTNGFGLPILNRRFYININGYMEPSERSERFRIGKKVGIDSCWIGSVLCPQGMFSSSIVDTIATESTLFIRQNQLVYYFTGHYPILHLETKGSASDKGFVMLLGTEVYTTKRLIARGLAYNPFSKAFYIWGNLWVSNENGIAFRKVYPSDAWNKFVALQTMRGSTRYPQSAKQAIVSIFYNKEGLHELVYMTAGRGKERFLKRDFPQDTVLTYDLLISTPHKKMTFNGKDYIRFTHRCPFAALRVLDLPHPQRFTRVEHYWATPPDVMEKSGFHDERSLTVYQGLVYQLLQLHTSYHRSYADPVHDPTWRWWKNQKEEAEYFNYKASNWKSLGGIYVDMANYAKIYNLMPDNDVPDTIYLDKNTAYSFNVFLTIRTARESLGETAEENSLHYIWLAIILAHPEYVQTELQRRELISRGSVLYRIVRSEMSCYHHTTLAPQLKGTDTMGIYIGCPPGKRLAFDITYTKNYTTEKNKRYFDCVEPDPEMPCFFFSDVFFPSFLIQDMVTGDSGQFHGRWICQKDSPCYDIVPQSMAAPDYYFVIKVSNRYLRFRNGLLSGISMATVIGLVVLYIVVDVVAPWVKQHCNRLVRKLEEVIAFRAESSLTFSSSFSSQSSLQKLPSDLSQGDPSVNVPFSSHIHSRKGPHHHGTQ
ncbi:hypothetical protein Chor_001934 [Crotalus horridus]